MIPGLTHGPNPSIVPFPDPWATPNHLQTPGLKKKENPSATVAETGLSPFFPSKSSYLKFVFHVFHGAWFKARFTCDRDKSCPNTHLSLIGQYNPFLQGCNLRGRGRQRKDKSSLLALPSRYTVRRDVCLVTMVGKMVGTQTQRTHSFILSHMTSTRLPALLLTTFCLVDPFFSLCIPGWPVCPYVRDQSRPKSPCCV